MASARKPITSRYTLFGLPNKASMAELTQAYKQLTAEYEFLSNAANKDAYDAMLDYRQSLSDYEKLLEQTSCQAPQLNLSAAQLHKLQNELCALLEIPSNAASLYSLKDNGYRLDEFNTHLILHRQGDASIVTQASLREICHKLDRLDIMHDSEKLYANCSVESIHGLFSPSNLLTIYFTEAGSRKLVERFLPPQLRAEQSASTRSRP